MSKKKGVFEAAEEREWAAFEDAVAQAGGVDSYLRQHGFDPEQIAKESTVFAKVCLSNALKAQRIAELEAALQRLLSNVPEEMHSDNCGVWAWTTCDCWVAEARAALEPGAQAPAEEA